MHFTPTYATVQVVDPYFHLQRITSYARKAIDYQTYVVVTNNIGIDINTSTG